jgi:hypothetical protein
LITHINSHYIAVVATVVSTTILIRLLLIKRATTLNANKKLKCDKIIIIQFTNGFTQNSKILQVCNNLSIVLPAVHKSKLVNLKNNNA